MNGLTTPYHVSPYLQSIDKMIFTVGGYKSFSSQWLWVPTRCGTPPPDGARYFVFLSLLETPHMVYTPRRPCVLGAMQGKWGGSTGSLDYFRSGVRHTRATHDHDSRGAWIMPIAALNRTAITTPLCPPQVGHVTPSKSLKRDIQFTAPRETDFALLLCFTHACGTVSDVFIVSCGSDDRYSTSNAVHISS